MGSGSPALPSYGQFKLLCVRVFLNTSYKAQGRMDYTISIPSHSLCQMGIWMMKAAQEVQSTNWWYPEGQKSRQTQIGPERTWCPIHSAQVGSWASLVLLGVQRSAQRSAQPTTNRFSGHWVEHSAWGFSHRLCGISTQSRPLGWEFGVVSLAGGEQGSTVKEGLPVKEARSSDRLPLQDRRSVQRLPCRRRSELCVVLPPVPQWLAFTSFTLWMWLLTVGGAFVWLCFSLIWRLCKSCVFTSDDGHILYLLLAFSVF